MSAVTVPGRPAATTRISARRVCSPRSRVPVWQSVTVAFAFGAFCDSMIASGIPTRLPRPTITTSRCSISMPERTSISTTPRGVQGRNEGSPRTMRPTLTGDRPSTSLSGEIASCSASTSIWGGTGSCTRIPSIAGSSFRRRTSASRSASGMSPGRFSRSEWIPTSRQSRSLPST